ncbi:hypothetical protein HYC85_005899 [Camellia sinensis]|uniref:Oleosin n=1 Tax=Camellia sinensis TaxID=4442 RepID=A0A7J7I2M6_CAMSI|nr:hypothetical protein HYC85_005899 [Camellia sinensis]
MADRPYPHQIQVHPQYSYDSVIKSLYPQSGPSPSKVLAILALPVSGTLLGLSGISLAVVTPLFFIFSLVLVPAAIVACLTLAGLMASGGFGLTGLTAMSWVLNYFRQASAGMPQQMEEVNRRMQDVAIQMGQKTKEVCETIKKKAQEAVK